VSRTKRGDVQTLSCPSSFAEVGRALALGGSGGTLPAFGCVASPGSRRRAASPTAGVR